MTALLENFWNRVQTIINTPGKCVSPYVIEIVAMLERVLNFAHTGNAQVLVKKLMDPAWLSLGCLLDGFPCISPNFVEHQSLGTNSVLPVITKWPINNQTHRALTASKRVQQLTYGDVHYEVSC